MIKKFRKYKLQILDSYKVMAAWTLKQRIKII